VIQSVRAGSDTLTGIVLRDANVNLLLPNSAVAEILTYRRPDPVKGTAAWLLGVLDWRDNLVPMISLGAAQTGRKPEDIGRRASIAVCYTPSGNPDLPYVAMLATDTPRLVNFRAANMKPASATRTNPFFLHPLIYDKQPAWIPDIDAIERAVLANQ